LLEDLLRCLHVKFVRDLGLPFKGSNE
jgi:hypothetical protein